MKTYTKDNYILRRFLPEEWEAYRDIRLEALQISPEMFGSNYAKESQYTKEDWLGAVDNPHRAMFGLYLNKNIVGVTGVAFVKEDHSQAVLIASFICPEYRGKGLSKLFYEARLDWARDMGCNSIVVSHREDNNPSKGANQSFGFKYTHSDSREWSDGKNLSQLYYILEL
jgi:RimJ/RimL family protein N-acetyltransferase